MESHASKAPPAEVPLPGAAGGPGALVPKEGQGGADPDWLQRGERVGLYVVERKVSRGGMGVVYEVSRDGHRFALKIPLVQPEALSEEDKKDLEERVLREVNALLALRHPNILRVRGFDRWPHPETGFLYILMDYVDGAPMDRWRLGARPSTRRVLQVTKKLGRALGFMHSHNVVHRDIKPQNILVRDDDEPVLVDFGISRPVSSYTVTRVGQLVGTLALFPPEYVEWFNKGASGRFVFRPTADLYSLGYTLYLCLAGKEPFPRDKDDENATLQAILKHEPPPPSSVNPQVPAAVDALVLRLLAKKPQARYQTGEELSEACEALLAQADASWDVALEPPASRAALGNTPNERGAPSAGVGKSASVGPSGIIHPLSADVVPPTPEPAAAAPVLEGEKAAPGFLAPTGARREFVPLEEAPSPLPAAGPSLSSGLLRAQRQLQSLSTPKSPVRVSLLVLGGVLVLVAGYITVAAMLAAGQRPDPKSLLTQVEKQQVAQAQGTQLETEEPPVVATASPDVEVVEPKGAAAVEEGTAGGAESGDSRQIDELLADSYGPAEAPSKKKVRPPAAAGAKAAPSGPAWLKRGQRIGGVPRRAEGAKVYGIPLGSLIRARLKTNLDSRTVADGPVTAVLMRPHVVRGEVVLPSRTNLYGTASASGARFTIRFTRMVLPDQTEVAFAGVAFDAGEQKPGLASSRRIAGAGPKSEGLGSKLAKGAAATALGKLEGGAEADLAKGAGHTALTHEKSDVGGGVADAILLDAGVDFEVFVAQAF